MLFFLLGCKPKVKPIDLNEDSESNLGHWGRAMSALQISQMGGDPLWFGGRVQPDNTALLTLLETDYHVTDRETLLRQMNYSLRFGAREDYHYHIDALTALLELPDEERETALEPLSQEDRLFYELVEYNYEKWGEQGVLGWDMARMSLLSQLGYSAGLLSREEAQAAIEPGAYIVRQYFSSFASFCDNVVDGEALYRRTAVEDPQGAVATLTALRAQLAEDHGDMLYRDALFSEGIVPLEGTSFSDFM